MKIVKTFSLLLFSFSVFGQADFSLVRNWRTFAIPTNQDTLNNYAHDNNAWIVTFNSVTKEIVAKNYDSKQNLDTLPFKIEPKNKLEKLKFRGRKFFVKVSNGYLVGFNRGEWNGNLFWFSLNGKNYYEISTHQIVQFIKRNGKLYAIEGLDHLSTSEGSIIEIKQKAGKWTTKDYLKLSSAPYAVKLDSKNNFIIVTSSSLFSIEKKGNIDTLLKDGFWSNYLYPYSMSIQNDIVYIGMTKGIYKFDLSSKNQEWLMPN